MIGITAELERCEAAPESREKINAFIELFSKWNSKINLSGASTKSEIEEHVIESLQVVPYLRTLEAPRILDVGSGGGFPSVIMAICLPLASITALEPIRKKHAFLRTVARELALANLEALAVRLEDHRGHDYDVAISRATFDLRDWLALGLERVRIGGLVLGMEGLVRTDLPEAIERHPYTLDDKTRAIVVARRV